MMPLRHSILVFLLFAANHSCWSLADQQTVAISETLKSYDNAYTSNPIKKVTPSTPVNKIVKRHDYRPIFTTIRSQEVNDNVPEKASSELKSTEYNSISKEFNDDSHQSEDETGKYEDVNEPPDHIIPFSEHEDPKEPATRPNYTAPGQWAKPSPNKNISLDFVPRKLYAQVRGTHTVKRLPREDAIKSAETNEEKENAARLKEVVKISKSNTVYSEEGYEDAAYDHAGQIKDANFHEDYAKKLKENLDSKKINPDDASSTNIKKLFKPSKDKSEDISNFSDYSDDVTEAVQEARISNQQITPKNKKVSENYFKEPVFDAKKIVQDSILQLEHDLKKVSYENQMAATEPYYYTKPTDKPAVTESTTKIEIEYETTTLKPFVYTIRPRKPALAFSTTRPATIKRPETYFREIKTNNNIHANNGLENEATNVQNVNLFSRYFPKIKNETPTQTYIPEYFESQTENPFIANPLAVATVNGHGPYLLVVTESTDTFTPSSLEHEGLQTTISYVTVPANNVSRAIKKNPYINNSYFIPKLQDSKRANKHIIPLYRNPADDRNEKPQLYTEKTFKPSPFKSPTNYAKVLEYLQNQKNNDNNYYKEAEPASEAYALVTFKNNLNPPYSNAQNQWSVTQESEKPVESVYDISYDIQRPRIDSRVQESAIPVTKLLPPAPLSVSEYTSFHIQDRVSEPIAPAIVNFVPFIAAIHNYKTDRKSIPFLFRKKRSVGPSRETEIIQRDERLKEAELQRNQDASTKSSSAKRRKSKYQTYPKNFEDLLNEAPKVVSEEISKEISERFENKSKHDSEEKSHESLSTESNEASNSKEKEIFRDNEKSTENDRVKVGVPELNFEDIFEKDEVEPTTTEPGIDVEKYPFYENIKVSKNNALKYVINPIEVPQKTFGGMEFYDSRNLDCDEIDPNLEKIVPEDAELANKSGPRKGKPKLLGLGDKVDCFKAKYFDENPLDNPLFFEKIIEVPPPPSELDPKKFASRILDLAPENDEYIVPRGPKSPEDFNVVKHQFIIKKIPNNYHYKPRMEKPRFIQKNEIRYRIPSDLMFPDQRRKRINKNRQRQTIKKSKTQVVPPAYQRQVYEDVMGTIMNMEHMYETPVPSHTFQPFHSSHTVHEFKNEQEYGEFDKPKKQREIKIDGLIPPPQYVFNTMPLKNNKFHHSDWKTVRVFKRSTEIESTEILNSTSNNANNISTINNENILQMVLTTPIPEKSKLKRKIFSIVSDELSTEIPINILNDKINSVNETAQLLGKYDKFTHNPSSTQSFNLRRKEPRYNIPKRINLIKNTSNIDTTFNPLESIFSTKASEISTDPSLSRSTLIPVFVKPDSNFTVRIPQESKTRYIKQKLENVKNDNQQGFLNDRVNNIDENTSNKKKLKNKNNQYLVHENTQEDAGKNDDTETDFTVEPDSQEHKELLDFLKGDPPGYTETFKHDTTPEYEEITSRDLLKNEESKINKVKEEEEEEDVDRPVEDENSKEVFVDESSADNSEDDSKENLQFKEKEKNSNNSQESDNDPFIRYSSRPHSPSENYEDERYSELGPRINKPYFYHPPFEVPEYEKRRLGKTAKQSNYDDWDQSEETEDHETYVFPWEKDNDEDDEKDEYFSLMSRYEYPWERRERKERERRKKARLQKKYGKNYLDSNEDEYEDEEATNDKPIYTRSRKKHSRNKKDVNNIKLSPKDHPVVQITSKHKSTITNDPLNDEKMLATVTNTDEVGKIMNYFQNKSSSSPKIKASQISHKSILNDKYTVSTTTNVPNKKSNLTVKAENATLTLPITLTISESEKISTNTTEPFLTKSSFSKYPNRTRSRNIRTKINTDSSEKVKSDKKRDHPNLSVRDSKAVRKRHRGTNNSSLSFISTTKSPIKTNSRIRNRPTTTTAPTVTSRILNRRSRRPSTIQSNIDKKDNITRINKRNTRRSSIPTSTVRTIEHHSRVSKEEIITKTFYPDGDEDDDEDDDLEENSSKLKEDKMNLEIKPKIKRRIKPKNDSQDDHAKKKKTVEKVTITMEETPNHVYRTKEIDRDGVKGKFISITSNNNSTTTTRHNNDLQMGDAEMEEMKRRINALSSFDNMNQETEELIDDPSEVGGAENYVVGNLLQKLPLPTTRERKMNPNEDTYLSDQYSSEEYNNVEDSDGNKNDDDNNSDSDNQSRDNERKGNRKYRDSSESSSEESNKNSNESSSEEIDKNSDENSSVESNKYKDKEGNKLKKNIADEPLLNFIKDPNSRNYFYVEKR